MKIKMTEEKFVQAIYDIKEEIIDRVVADSDLGITSAHILAFGVLYGEYAIQHWKSKAEALVFIERVLDQAWKNEDE